VTNTINAGPNYHSPHARQITAHTAEN